MGICRDFSALLLGILKNEKVETLILTEMMLPDWEHDIFYQQSVVFGIL